MTVKEEKKDKHDEHSEPEKKSEPGCAPDPDPNGEDESEAADGVVDSPGKSGG